jgi:hypothetical protein
MSPIHCSHVVHPLEAVRQRFENWRKTRTKRNPIPEKLWQDAVDLYPAHSLHEISKALRLNHTALKRRVLSVPGLEADDSPFIKVDISSMVESRSECVIEMSNRHGCRMKMYFKGRVEVDLLALGRSFWDAGS